MVEFGSTCQVVFEGEVLVLPAHMLDEHPGGRDVIMAMQGRDITLEFAEAHHSESARRWALSFKSQSPMAVDNDCLPARSGFVADDEASRPWYPVFLSLVSLTSALVAYQLRA
jgi:cytochrome b involved in lipid metabolism